MPPKVIRFKNRNGAELSGRLELPADRHPHSYAIFAHCFTCTKNLTAVRNISRALNSFGFGVLRFDFTGLGDSEGDFSESDFSGNISDLIAASDFLQKEFMAPRLLIGHSLGGAAAIYAAAKLDNIEAVASIAAPSSPDHVINLFREDLGEIEKKGKADVNIGGRNFTIKKEFLEDLRSVSMPDVLKKLRKPLLLLHSPQDTIVSIENAKAIYEAAFHPKSFISLDGADHLLTDIEDSAYTGNVIAEWAARYIDYPKEPEISSRHEVVARLEAENKFTTTMKLGRHYITADEPVSVGGNDFGPTPYDFLSASLASCTAMTVKMYTDRKKWPLESIEVHVSYSREHKKDSQEAESGKNPQIDVFEREIIVKGITDKAQLDKILEIADKCPVHRTLHSDNAVKTRLVED
ncbi:bifunctional alpha/beta hydrolase/OsmC family protein [Robertkochia aurantiaca]|uniref:bifunctional alpha/beta hydrolase/OsmC family protein n=1 Tax=Robertkochia aurantiaca TaxID=2873700 RepID=UPI001CCF22A1|nr:bifunctional alpha/beta hydrolase/OsmC family protein [Robertkochia sp. 3YJGBD-33]